MIGLHSDEPVLKAEKANLPYDIVERDGEVMIKVEHLIEQLFVISVINNFLHVW